MFKKLELITPTLLEVFSLFLENPMQEYHQREVVRKTHVSLGSANRILKLLADNDFLTLKKKGKMIFYRLNAEEPSVKQFKVFINVFMLKPLLQAIDEHCRRIVMFGSTAQGTDVRDSDIDLFVILSGEKDLVRKEISEFNRKRSSRKIAPILVSANEYAKLKRDDKPLYENIERGITLWQAAE